MTRPLVPTNPRGAPPVPAGKPGTPRPPVVSAGVGTPRAPLVQSKLDSEPPAGGWDAADDDTATSFPEPTELPAPTPRNLPPVKAPAAAAPATQASPPAVPGTVRGPYQTSPGVGGPPQDSPGPRAAARAPTGVASAMASSAGLGSAMREEVWAIVRAAVEEAMGPLVARQRELEARVERAERFADAARGGGRAAGAGIPSAAAQAAPPGPSTAAARLAALGPATGSIPVEFGPAAPPPPPPARVPSFEVSPGSATTPDLRPAASAVPHPVGPRPSLPPTGTYGVTVMPSMRPSLDLSTVGEVDISGFDGGRSKRRVATAVVIIMILIIAGVVTMTLLSHS